MKFALILASAFLWALWLGGTILVFILGSGFNRLLSQASFHDAAHAMFQIFAKYELTLAGLALLTSGLLLVSYPSKAAVLLVAILVLSGGMVVTVALGLMPRMEVLRSEGRTQIAIDGKLTEYGHLHVKSMIAMSIQAGLLALSGVVIMNLDSSKVKIEPLEYEHANGYEKHAGLSRRM